MLMLLLLFRVIATCFQFCIHFTVLLVVYHCIFCFRRQRNYKPNVSPYVINYNSLRISQPNQVTFDVTNTDNGKAFVVDLFGFEDRTFRLKINEAAPIKPRYEVVDVIDKLSLQS